MNLREFSRFYLLKTLFLLVVVQIGIIAIVQNYNHRPRAYADKTSTFEGKPIKITPLANDSDKDEKDELMLKYVSLPQHGFFRRQANELDYTPQKDFVGVDSFAYTITDGRKESKKAYITVIVNKNQEPIANADTAQVYKGDCVIIDVLDNDKDREGDSIFIKEFTKPVFGQLKKFENKIIYFANTSLNRADSFSYCITDGKNKSKEAKVRINILDKNDPAYPWLSSDIGNAVKPGSTKCINRSFIVEASGSDIWNSFDGFRYVYQYVDGNFEMYVKVEKFEGINDWAKAGIMVRENLNGGSKMAFVCVTTKNGIIFQKRIKNNEDAEGGELYPELKTPYWLLVKRNGNNFIYFVSADGKSWKNMGSTEIPMSRNVYIGLALSSHNNNELAQAIFSNYNLKAKRAIFEMQK